MPGGQNLGEIDDLRFFTNKLFRGLRIPSSYLPTGPDDGSQTINDGRVGTALIQEWRFNQYCKRLQKMVVEPLDQEFKMFMRWRGINIDNGIFELRFNEPQNFSGYRQAEIDNPRIQAFGQMAQFPFLSKRFLMSRYLGLTEEEMQENDERWEEENGEDVPAGEAAGLRSVGITPGGLTSDIDAVSPPEGAPEGGEGAPEGGAIPPEGGAPGAGAAPDLGPAG